MNQNNRTLSNGLNTVTNEQTIQVDPSTQQIIRDGVSQKKEFISLEKSTLDNQGTNKYSIPGDEDDSNPPTQTLQEQEIAVDEILQSDIEKAKQGLLQIDENIIRQAVNKSPDDLPKGESALTSEQNRMMGNEQNRIASINDGQVVNLNEKIKKRRFKKKKMANNSAIEGSKLSSDVGDVRDRTMKTIKF